LFQIEVEQVPQRPIVIIPGARLALVGPIAPDQVLLRFGLDLVGVYRRMIIRITPWGCLRKPAHPHYELVEIPVPLFSQIMDIGREHFAADGPTINIPIGKNPPDFT